MKELSLPQMSKVSHALGINLFDSAMSHLLKDKTLPKSFYRNYYQTGRDDVFEELITLGYAAKELHMRLNYYHITPEGEAQFRSQFPEIVNYKPVSQRDLNYLRRRINLYCDFCLYRFCEDNSDHIISAYLNYWIKKYYVFHTTEDTIKKFHTELASYYKRGLLQVK